MGQIDGFMKFNREMPPSRDTKERLKDYKEVYTPLAKQKVKEQSARFMVVRWVITFPTLMMRFTRANGRRQSIY
jgi:hypothetical protein